VKEEDPEPMPLVIGARLGPYEILSPLGAGGMGEVYRARDTKLNRDVALKILPQEFALDAERLARFKREAQVLASLNHPNIAAIYGLEDADGAPALVLELVEGPTLADRIANGPIPINDALPIARQMAEAIEAAHEKGVIHRDLKPANVKFTADGAVKVLDFGLAKILEAGGAPAGGAGEAGRVARGFSPASVTNSPTITTPAMTQLGVILGTAAYMSPEQAKGRGADKRSDIWAFGCVLYEMVTGKRAFEGEDVSDTLATVLKSEPNWKALPEDIPPVIRILLARCLRKDPKRRLPAIAVAALDMDDALAGPQAMAVNNVHVARGPGRERLAWTIATIAVVSAIALGFANYFRNPPLDDRATRFTIPLPESWRLASAPVPFKISPDGRRVVFAATDLGSRTMLWIRALDSLTSQELPGTDGATAFFWSPDSRNVGFWASGKLKKIDVAGGRPITLCDAGNFQGGAWNQDGIIIFASAQRLKRVSESGGIPIDIDTSPTAGTPSLPSFLPDNRHFFYRAFGGLFIASLDSAERKEIFGVGGPVNVEYADGHLVYERDGTLMAQRFDHRRLELSGEPSPIADGINKFSVMQTALFSTSSTGTLVYQTGTSDPSLQLVWLDRSGKQLATVGEPADYADVSLSPDGKQVAATILDPAQRTRNIWIVDVGSGRRRQFTFDPADELAPVWSPDGSSIAFNSRRQERTGLYQKPSNGAGSEETLFEFPPETLAVNPLGWTADGRSLLFVGGTQGAAVLSVLPLSGERKPVTYLTGREAGPGQLSPDNRWIAHFSGESGRTEVYVTPYPNRGGKWRVSTDGGTQPRWRSDGKEIFYVNRESKIVAAEVTAQGDGFQVEAVRPLFGIRGGGARYAYDVSPDGQRFLVNKRIEDHSPSSPLTVVVNWPAALRR
jgi:eukaryotic-like serine/threonine-protein kinase